MTPDCAKAPEPQRQAVARTANPKTFLIDIPPGWTCPPFRAQGAKAAVASPFQACPIRLILPGGRTVAGNRDFGKRNYYANRKKSLGCRFVRIYREVLPGAARLPAPAALAMAVGSSPRRIGETSNAQPSAARRQEKWLT